MIYSIYTCTEAEKPLLMQFIDQYWSKGHILSYCGKLLDFQHKNATEGFNFLLAFNSQTAEIDGVFGFIPTWQYDRSLYEEGCYWGAIWKTRQEVTNPEIKLLGIVLWRKIMRLPHFKSYYTAGISQIAKQIYVASGLEVGYLRQYYIANDACSDFRIAQLSGGTPTTVWSDKTITLREVTIDQMAPIAYPYYPKKTPEYLRNRYEKHPIYHYTFLGVYVEQELHCVLITRTIETQGARVIRIVDIYGSIALLPPIYGALQSLLAKQNAEYIDCLNYGIEPEVFHRIGFSELDPEQSRVIIPNYFEPFLRENVKIECVHTKAFNFVIFKGDGDQDRPNKI